MAKDEVKTSQHYLLHYSVFPRLRLKHLGSLTFGERENMAKTDISSLNKFVVGPKCLVE